MRTFAGGTSQTKHESREIPVIRAGGTSKDNSLIFMAQNASVETVTARMYKTEGNDFILGARWKYLDGQLKSVLQ